MKAVLITLLLLSSLLLSSCKREEDNIHVMPMHFSTTREKGVNYYRAPIDLDLDNGQLIFQNMSEMPIKLSIYDETEHCKLQYEVTLDSCEYVAYSNLNKGDKYVLGISVESEVGSKDVSLLTFNSYDYFYSSNLSEKQLLASSNQKWYEDVFEELGLILIL